MKMQRLEEEKKTLETMATVTLEEKNVLTKKVLELTAYSKARNRCFFFFFVVGSIMNQVLIVYTLNRNVLI